LKLSKDKASVKLTVVNIKNRGASKTRACQLQRRTEKWIFCNKRV